MESYVVVFCGLGSLTLEGYTGCLPCTEKETDTRRLILTIPGLMVPFLDSVVTACISGLSQRERQRLAAPSPALEEAGGRPPPPLMFAVFLLLLILHQVEPALWGLIKLSQLLQNTGMQSMAESA